ncbi:hypothetical protein MXB_2059 [Myxobolus squamalis]|nr:hypothetical protein MXB_2059 [Myxobolus squamalis]
METNSIIQLFDRKIIFILPLLYHQRHMKELSDCLFNQYKVRAIFPLYDCVASILPLGISSALVVDFGYEYTRISPVYQYYPIKNSFAMSATSTKALLLEILKQIKLIKPYSAINLLKDEKSLNAIICILCVDTLRLQRACAQTTSFKYFQNF